MWNTAAALIFVCAASAEVTHAGDWTNPVEVRHELKRCVSYRAKWDAGYLVVRATLDPGWHTFAMDNRQRAADKLAGKKSLGIDLPTEITVTEGLEVVGPWYQLPPKDFSKPELRWFSWGFEDEALFVAQVRRSRGSAAQVTIRGQACSDTTCKNIDLAITVPLGGGGKGSASDFDLKTLVQVR